LGWRFHLGAEKIIPTDQNQKREGGGDKGTVLVFHAGSKPPEWKGWQERRRRADLAKAFLKG
jgi:hypothetical protein